MNLALDATPENIQSQHNTLLRYVGDTRYTRFKKQLMDKAERIKKLGLSTQFFITNIRASSKGYLDISGIFKSSIGTTVSDEKRQHYRVSVGMQSGRPILKNLIEINERGEKI